MRVFVSGLLSVRGLFWFAWVWVLLYVAAAVWSKEAFARFMGLLDHNVAVQTVAFLFVLVAGVSFVRYALGGLRSRGPSHSLWCIFPAGAFVFLLGFVLMGVFGEREVGFVRQGDVMRTYWDGKDYAVMELDLDLKEKEIMAEEPVGFLKSEPGAVLVTKDRSCRIRAFPPSCCNGTYAHIRDYGMAPGIVLEKQGAPVRRGHINLKILPPGAPDVFELDGLPYRFLIRLAPDRVVESGGKLKRLYDLGNPRFEIRVEKAGQAVFEGTSDDRIAFEGYELVFTSYKKWIWLDMGTGRGLPVMAAGLLLMAAGAPVSVLLAAARLWTQRRRALEA